MEAWISLPYPKSMGSSYSSSFVQYPGLNTESIIGGQVIPLCYSGQMAKVTISWTANNPGRRFFGCPNYGDNGACRFFHWLDPPVNNYQNAAINGLLRNKQSMTRELKNLGRREKILVGLLLLSWVACVMLMFSCWKTKAPVGQMLCKI